VANAAGGLSWHDRRDRFAAVMVTGPRPANGLVELPFEVAVQRVDADVTTQRPEPARAEETAR
jgi:hypothetical protein